MKFLLILLFMLIHANVSSACYTDIEAEAEQALRIHSELLVIGLTCIKMPDGMATYNKYKNFTNKNSSLISEYEEVLIDYFEREGSSNPEIDIHNLRSLLANDVAGYSVTMGTQSFCDMFTERLYKVENMTSYQFRRWARHSISENPTTEPRCAYR